MILHFLNTSNSFIDANSQFHNTEVWHKETSPGYVEALEKLQHPKKVVRKKTWL